jgi:hypothetical protein
MGLDLLGNFSAAYGGTLIRQLSSSLDEPEGSVRMAIRSLGPALVAALMQHAAKPSGVVHLYGVINDERIDEGIIRKLPAVCGSRSNVDAFAHTGEMLGRFVFGHRVGAVVNAVSGVSGIALGSSLRLLSIALPVVFGIVRWHISRHDMTATGLTSLLLDQRRSLEHAGLDGRITNAMGFSNLSSLLEALPRDIPQERPMREHVHAPAPEGLQRTSDWSWVVAAGVAALALLTWVGA